MLPPPPLGPAPPQLSETAAILTPCFRYSRLTVRQALPTAQPGSASTIGAIKCDTNDAPVRRHGHLATLGAGAPLKEQVEGGAARRRATRTRCDVTKQWVSGPTTAGDPGRCSGPRPRHPRHHRRRQRSHILHLCDKNLYWRIAGLISLFWDMWRRKS